jgi:DNA-directed RNA polymerase specialized sigma24 family protein
MSPGRGAFHSTRWTLVYAAASPNTELARAALSDLVETYWYPLYVYARRAGHDADTARDIVQGFWLSLWERDDLRAVSPERGRFRSFLLAALKHYISNRRAHERAQKRGGGVAPVPLELDDAETRFRADPAGGETPESAFERQWALELLAQVFAEIRVEWDARGKAAEFDRLKPLLLDEAAHGGFAAAARDLGTTDTALRMAATRLRQRFRQVLRQTVAETTADEDIDEELRFLLRVLDR